MKPILSATEVVERLKDLGYIVASPPTYLQGGEWSSAWAFDCDGDPFVVRFGQHIEDYQKDALCAQRNTANLPITEIVELGWHADGAFAISRRVEGTAFDLLPAADLIATLPSLLHSLDTLREIQPPHSGFGLWDADGRGEHTTWTEALLSVANPNKARIFGWRDALDTRPLEATVFDHAVGVLQRLAPRCPTRNEIVHGDLLNGNVLVVDRQITGLLDWGCVMTGDSLYDIAMLCFWAPWHGTLDGAVFRDAMDRLSRDAPLGPDRELRSACYELHTGLESMRYTAFKHRWDDLERCAVQVADIARAW